MSRTVFIITSIVVVIALLGVWVYVLFFSTPNNGDQGGSSETFANLDFNDTTDPSYVPNDTADTFVDTDNSLDADAADTRKIKQLTIDPVIGFQEVITNNEPEAYYITPGTGNIFAVNVVTNEERPVSNTTIPNARRGAITPDGRFTLIQTGTGAGSEFVLGEISSTSTELTLQFLTDHLVDFTATADNTFLYTAKVNNVVIGKEYFPVSKTSKTLFTVPFQTVAIRWGTSAHTLFPKATSQLEGYLYQAEGGVINRLPISGFGISAVSSDTHTIYSTQENGAYRTFTYDNETNTQAGLFLTAFPEKCVATHVTTTFLCASTQDKYGALLPERWYQGTESYSDSLWEIDLAAGEGAVLSNIIADTGRTVDVINPLFSDLQGNLYFQNKLDNTLWTYRYTQDTTDPVLTGNDIN